MHTPFLPLCVILLSILLQACASKEPTPYVYERPEGAAVTVKESQATFIQSLHPRNQAMRSWMNLAPSIDKSLQYVSSKPEDRIAVDRKGLHMTFGDMKKTLLTLKNLLPKLDKDPSLFAEYFTWVPIENGINYSSYYSPVVRASKTPKKGYTHPIYRRPPDLHDGERYYSRREIEAEKKLADRNLELAWAADPVDVFFLEIQGSGCLLMDNGERICINYDGKNGHKYISSGKIMGRRGLLKRGDIFEQRQWFKDHPDQVTEILHENPSFIFFKLGGKGPTGAMGYIVDAWKSLATDKRVIPLGSVVAYGVNIPDPKYGTIPLRGIGFAQDVGGAIKKNRIDIYAGEDERANYVASFLDAKGPAWVLKAK
ncbi:MAG: MltA domain-containing protein [Desulfovibrio sp.]|nr:MltA domain-containing protein [Desulfovibrio sp.]